MHTISAKQHYCITGEGPGDDQRDETQIASFGLSWKRGLSRKAYPATEAQFESLSGGGLHQDATPCAWAGGCLQ